jgi:hypothetical protein
VLLCSGQEGLEHIQRLMVKEDAGKLGHLRDEKPRTRNPGRWRPRSLELRVELLRVSWG